jgi:hypothetical protein
MFACLTKTDTAGEVENVGEARFTPGVHAPKRRNVLAPFLYLVGC